MSKRKTNFASLVIILIVVAAIGAAIYYFGGDKAFVPESFAEARKQGSLIGEQIVSMTEDSIKGLNEISEEDKQYHFPKALDLVHQQLKNVAIAKEKAIKLTTELNKMAEAVPQIQPREARNISLAAVSEEVSLVSHLVNYNSYFDGLLETLRLKFTGDIRYDSSDVQALIENMNREAGEINKLNESFNQKMREFDILIGS